MTFKSGSDYAEAKKTEKAASIRLTIGLVWSGETAATARVRLPDYHGKLRVRWKRGRWSAESTGGVIIN